MCAPRAWLAQTDAHRLPFAAHRAAFDVVVCHNSFPHFAHQAAALRELGRALAPGGTLLILHDLSRERVNAIHGGAGGAIANDLLPPGEDLHAMLLAAGYGDVWVEDGAAQYRATGRWG